VKRSEGVALDERERDVAQPYEKLDVLIEVGLLARVHGCRSEEDVPYRLKIVGPFS